MQMQAQQLWQAVLGDMKARLNRSAFENWLRPTTIVAFENDVATVAAANTFGASTLQSRYAAQIEEVFSTIVGRPIEVEFTVLNADSHEVDELRATAPDASPRDTADRKLVFGQVSPPARSTKRGSEPPPAGKEPPIGKTKQLELTAGANHGLNPRYVYEHYVVGSSNRLAHAASQSVAERPGGQYNPFFVHGGVGLGKTHLLHAIGHRAIELHPGITVSYVSSERFTNDLINAIRAQRMEEFRARYRLIDILMIDDIQFIAGKDSTQEEFFHTFNELYQSGKQVVISSDRPPKAMSALEDRLKSRFEGGLIADVQLPDYEMRTAILRAKADELGAKVPDDVAEYIAQKDQTNIRELEGALNKVLAYSQITGHALTLQLAMEALTDASISNRRKSITQASVVEAVGRHYEVSLRELTGRARNKEIVLPRQVAMYLLREETDSSLVDIGHELGHRDHTTVMHGITKIERELTTNTSLRSQIMAIREALFTSDRT
ncbi:MAG: chromosomal replication initiator protein DnaA [Thermomicrobiales bacterium]